MECFRQRRHAVHDKRHFTVRFLDGTVKEAVVNIAAGIFPVGAFFDLLHVLLDLQMDGKRLVDVVRGDAAIRCYPEDPFFFRCFTTAAIMRTFLPFNVTHVVNGNKIFIMRDKKIPPDKLLCYRRDRLSSDKTTSNGSGFNRAHILSPVHIEQEERLCSPYSDRWYCRICIPSCMAAACCVSPSSSLRCFKIFVFMRIRYLLFIA